jgi:putative oxidoreductase
MYMIIIELERWHLSPTSRRRLSPANLNLSRRTAMSIAHSVEARIAPLTLAALRVASGALFLAHGLVKVVGFPAGAQPGLQPLLSLFGVGGAIEVVTGALLIAGLFTRPAAFIASGQMAVAYWMFHAPASIYPAVNGGDAAILFSFIFLHIAAVGAGAFSLDGLLRGKGSEPGINLAVPVTSKA